MLCQSNHTAAGVLGDDRKSVLSPAAPTDFGSQDMSTWLLRYDTRYYFNVRSKADISQLNLPHGTDN